VSTENRSFIYSSEEITSRYCNFCGHEHERGHFCRDQGACDETEQKNERDFVNEAGSYGRRRR
jgi:hypothetical protein